MGSSCGLGPRSEAALSTGVSVTAACMRPVHPSTVESWPSASELADPDPLSGALTVGPEFAKLAKGFANIGETLQSFGANFFTGAVTPPMPTVRGGTSVKMQNDCGESLVSG